jgi:hypothetical protein
LSLIDPNRGGRNAYLSAYLSLIGLVLCGTLLPGIFDVRAASEHSGQAAEVTRHESKLDAGFHLLYELKLAEARNQFESWQKSHPEDPLGYASEAAAFLFEECYRQGILTSDFFLDDKRFLGKIPLKSHPELRSEFFAADQKAQDLAQKQLKSNPDDPNALFAMTLSLGMQADYASLIDKRQLDSLKMIRDAESVRQKAAGDLAGRRRRIPHLGCGELHHRKFAGNQETFPRFRWNPR